MRLSRFGERRWIAYCQNKVSDDSEVSVTSTSNKNGNANSVGDFFEGSVTVVRDALVEESAIVAEAVSEGVAIAAESVSLAGELLPSVHAGDDSVLTETDTSDSDKSTQENALITVAFWFSSAVLFGIGIGFNEGASSASEFFAGYLLEQSLSVDNLLVFVLIFNYFKVPFAFQPRVLTYGIAGAILFRGIMIALGVATLEAFSSINLVFAAILLFSSYKLLAEAEADEEDDLSNNAVVQLCQKAIHVTDQYDGDKFFTLVDGVKKATPLLLTLAVVELSDVVFAVDSIPAVFGVTHDPFIVYTSNIFAILGLRSVYTLVSSSVGELRYLQTGVAVVLGFIGTKMVVDFAGFHVPTEVSLAVVASVLGGAVFLSLRSEEEG